MKLSIKEFSTTSGFKFKNELIYVDIEADSKVKILIKTD